jgi:hypothetical protein
MFTNEVLAQALINFAGVKPSHVGEDILRNASKVLERLKDIAADVADGEDDDNTSVFYDDEEHNGVKGDGVFYNETDDDNDEEVVTSESSTCRPTFSPFSCGPFVATLDEVCEKAQSSSSGLAYHHPTHVLVAITNALAAGLERDAAITIFTTWLQSLYQRCQSQEAVEKAVKVALARHREYVVLREAPLDAVVLRGVLRALDPDQQIKLLTFPDPICDENTWLVYTVDYKRIPFNTYVPLVPRSVVTTSTALFVHSRRQIARCARRIDAVRLMRLSLQRYYNWRNYPVRFLRYISTAVQVSPPTAAQ